MKGGWREEGGGWLWEVGRKLVRYLPTYLEDLECWSVGGGEGGETAKNAKARWKWKLY